MVTQRVLPSNYLGTGLAIATCLATILAPVPQAQAQAPSDLNLQTQLNIIMPPASPETPVTTTQQPTKPFAGLDQTLVCLNTGAVFVPTEKLRSIAAKIKALGAKNAGVLGVKKNAPPLTSQEIKDTIEGSICRGAANLTEEDRRDINKKFKILITAINPNPGIVTRQRTKVQINFPFNPSYETNTLKSLGNNNSPGESAGFGGNMQVTSGVDGRPWDFVILSAQEASSRYTPKFSPSVDGLTEQASYQLFLHAYGYNANTKMFVDNLVPGSPSPPLPGGTTTFDTATFSVINQTGFAPTFKNEKSDFLTPQISLARQNIGLDDSSGKPCVYTTTSPTGGTATNFCYYANASLTAGQSFSDVRTLENVNLSASATLGWNIPNSQWSLTLPATATAKDYEHVVGGRRDLLLQVGPVLSYNFTSKINMICHYENAEDKMRYGFCDDKNISFAFKLPVTYYKNYSTLSTAAWSGWVIMPTLTISFNYTEPLPTKP